MTPISAVIITQNEQRNIERCLQSLQGVADEIIVVDSGSTDTTEAICRSHGAQFLFHQWEGYAGQKNYADTLASHPWTLSIDADEALSPRLRDTLVALKQSGLDPGTVYNLRRLTNFCGSWIHHCGWYPDTKVRLWSSGTATWQGQIHEEVVFSHHHRVVTLDGDLLHYSYYTIDDLARRQPSYYNLAAREAFAQGRRATVAHILFKPLWTFLHDYILRLGILDGTAGYTVCRMNAHYTFMKYTTLRQLASTPGA